MEKIAFNFAQTDETVDFFVLEQTKINGVQYLLVTEEEAGDTDAYILKNVADTAAPGTDPADDEVIYEMVEDDQELEVVSKVFEQELGDVSIEM